MRVFFCFAQYFFLLKVRIFSMSIRLAIKFQKILFIFHYSFNRHPLSTHIYLVTCYLYMVRCYSIKKNNRIVFVYHSFLMFFILNSVNDSKNIQLNSTSILIEVIKSSIYQSLISFSFVSIILGSVIKIPKALQHFSL